MLRHRRQNNYRISDASTFMQVLLRALWRARRSVEICISWSLQTNDRCFWTTQPWNEAINVNARNSLRSRKCSFMACGWRVFLCKQFVYSLKRLRLRRRRTLRNVQIRQPLHCWWSVHLQWHNFDSLFCPIRLSFRLYGPRCRGHFLAKMH